MLGYVTPPPPPPYVILLNSLAITSFSMPVSNTFECSFHAAGVILSLLSPTIHLECRGFPGPLEMNVSLQMPSLQVPTQCGPGGLGILSGIPCPLVPRYPNFFLFQGLAVSLTGFISPGSAQSAPYPSILSRCHLSREAFPISLSNVCLHPHPPTGCDIPRAPIVLPPLQYFYK